MSTMLEPHSPQPPIVADSVLMERLAQRDSTALVELQRRHRASLYAQAYGVLMDAIAAERVVGDVFAQLWLIATQQIRGATESPLTVLRSMARELTRAERALRESP